MADHLDLSRLRAEAKQLMRDASDGDPAALERILTSHPKYAGRPAERLEGRAIGLGDAQVTVARESGYETWKELLADIEDTTRWDPSWSRDIQHRAFKEARNQKRPYCSAEHFLLALLAPPEPTAASRALEGLGLSYDLVAEQSRKWSRRQTDDAGASSTPVYQQIVGMAQGLAVGLGAKAFTDEHVLLAMIYSDWADRLFIGTDLDRDDVIDALAAQGETIPELDPPVAPTPFGPWGDWVYFDDADFQVVTQAIMKRFPPGSMVWGWNQSRSEEGRLYVHGEDGIPLEEIVKDAVGDTATIEVVSLEEGARREREP